MQALYIVAALATGMVMGAGASGLRNSRKLREIANALDCRKDKEDVLQLKTLQEGKYAFLYDELNLLYDRTEYAVEALKQDKADMKRYIADISHQLKTPLAAMITYLELLQRSETGHKEKEMLYNCMYLSEKMDTLLRSLLDLARFDAEEIVFNYRECNIADLIKKVIADTSLCNFWEKPEIQFACEEEENPVMLWMDEYWMFHALQNIIKNSIYYGGKPPKVEIALLKKSDMAEVRIADNGDGISGENKNAIFERFYRAGDKRKEGYGIGLALAKTVVEKHGGNLFVVNQPGACFVMQLFCPVSKVSL